MSRRGNPDFMTASPFAVSGRSVARLIGALAGGSLVATPLFAQVAPPPVPAPVATPQATTPPVTAPRVAPPLAIAPPVSMPTLSDAQAHQLATLIAKGEVTQGLRQGAPRDLSGLAPAAIARIALDYAHAVHVGRLDTADFSKDWGIRPQSYDPLPGFADAVRQDRIADWIAAVSFATPSPLAP